LLSGGSLLWVWFLIEANLAQNVKSAACWVDGCLFHPCLVAWLNRQANTFFNFQWDGCGGFFEPARRPWRIPDLVG
jgi:hypothetical protein